MSEEKKGFFGRLKAGLTKTRDNIVHSMDSVFGGFSSIDDDFYEELEEILIMGDIGVNATEEILERLKKQVKENHIKDPQECKDFLISNIKEQMQAQMDADENVYYWLNDDIEEWNFKAITDETSFYLNEKDHVVIGFDEGEVAPMYMGTVEFEIPAEVLEGIRK